MYLSSVRCHPVMDLPRPSSVSGPKIAKRKQGSSRPTLSPWEKKRLKREREVSEEYKEKRRTRDANFRRLRIGADTAEVWRELREKSDAMISDAAFADLLIRVYLEHTGHCQASKASSASRRKAKSYEAPQLSKQPVHITQPQDLLGRVDDTSTSTRSNQGSEDPPSKRSLELETSGQQKCLKRDKPSNLATPCNNQEVAAHPMASGPQAPAMQVYEEATEDVVREIGAFSCGEVVMIKWLNTKALILEIDTCTETAVTSLVTRDGDLVDDISIILPLSKLEKCLPAQLKTEIKTEDEDSRDGDYEATTDNLRVKGHADSAESSSSTDSSSPVCSKNAPVQHNGVNAPPSGLANSSPVTKQSLVTQPQSENVTEDGGTNYDAFRLEGHVESPDV